MLGARESIVPGSSQDVVPQSETGETPESAAPSQTDTEYCMGVFGEVEISEADQETIQPQKQSNPDQPSDWDAHVEKLIDDLNADDLCD